MENTTSGDISTLFSSLIFLFNLIAKNQPFSPPSYKISSITTGLLSQSLFQTPGRWVESRAQSSVGTSRSSAKILNLLSLDPKYNKGNPSGSRVTEPLMISPVGKGGLVFSPVLASTK